MIEDWKIRKSDFFFFIAYILFLFYKIMETATLKKVVNVDVLLYIKFFSWFLLTVKILFCNKINIKLLLGYGLLISLGICIRIKSGFSDVLELILVIIAANDIDFKRIVKITLIETALLCMIIVMSSIIGIIPNYYFKRANGKYAMSLGFLYVSKLANYVLSIIFLSLYMKSSQKKVATNLQLLGFFLLATVVFKITYVRNPYFMSILFLLLYYLVEKQKIIELKKYKNIISLMFIISFGIIFFLVTNYESGNVIFLNLNKVLSNRLEIMNRVYNTCEVLPFGQDVIFKGLGAINENYTYVDSGYISLLLQNGYIILVLIGISYTYLLRKSLIIGDNVLSIWLILISISAIADDALIQVGFNCTLLMLFNTIKTKDVKYKWKEKKIDEDSSSYCNI